MVDVFLNKVGGDGGDAREELPCILEALIVGTLSRGAVEIGGTACTFGFTKLLRIRSKIH